MFNPDILKAYRIAFLKYRTLSNMHRWYFFDLLAKNPNLSVNEYVELSGYVQPMVSQYLGMLRAAGIALHTKKGRVVTYAINHPTVLDLIQTAGIISQQPLKESDEISTLASLHHPQLMNAYRLFKALNNRSRIYILDFLYHNPKSSLIEISQNLLIPTVDINSSFKMINDMDLVIKTRSNNINKYILNTAKLAEINQSLLNWHYFKK